MLDRKYRSILSGVVLLLVGAYFVWKLVGGTPGAGASCDWTERHPVAQLHYSNHARCRMACRNIDEALVEQVYLHGEVNCKKSSLDEAEPRYALEDRDPAGDRIRIIVADDHGQHVIVTVIRLDQDDKCSCS